eukprot:m.146041 g.146041  ORF g.146041 m.146041 type:complete len:58 (+) comp14148_c2_seq2:65-238(+)
MNNSTKRSCTQEEPNNQGNRLKGRLRCKLCISENVHSHQQETSTLGTKANAFDGSLV